MIFRQLYDATSSTYTYLLGCPETRAACVIDPVFERFARDAALVHELGLSVRYVIDTHVHADHVTAAWRFKREFGAEIALSGEYGASGVDVALADGDVLAFGHFSLQAMATPGHTVGCMSFVSNDRSMAMTGDALLIRGAGRTDFQGGSEQQLWQSIQGKLFTLPDDCLLYPAHDYDGRTVSSVIEEKRFNPRIGGDAQFEDFSGYMQNLNLPHPRLLEIAVPANLACGEPEQQLDEPGWGPVRYTFAGIPEVDPDWVARHEAELSIVDVREMTECDGELGKIDAAVVIPLGQLKERADEIDQSKPVVVVCQSGKRSARAVQMLQAAGVQEVANVAGGMLLWNQLALPRQSI